MLDRHAHGLGECCVRIGDEVDALGLLGALPGFHDVGIVHGQADDIIDTGIAEILESRDEPRHVCRAASRRERTGQRKQNQALAAEQLVTAYAVHGTVPKRRELHLRNLRTFAEARLLMAPRSASVRGSPPQVRKECGSSLARMAELDEERR
jgi:hypothetical protein